MIYIGLALVTERVSDKWDLKGIKSKLRYLNNRKELALLNIS